MSLYCVDCHVLIWGIRQWATPGQESKIPQALAFFEQCQRQRDTILVPSVVLAEFLSFTDPADLLAAEGVLTTRFQIGSFDIKAAQKFGEIFRAKYPALKHEEPNKVKMKKDFMIVATAVVCGATAIISEDEGLVRFAEGMIPVIGLPHAQIQTEFTDQFEPQEENGAAIGLPGNTLTSSRLIRD